MTVRELIERLSAENQESIVCILAGDVANAVFSIESGFRDIHSHQFTNEMRRQQQDVICLVDK